MWAHRDRRRSADPGGAARSHRRRRDAAGRPVLACVMLVADLTACSSGRVPAWTTVGDDATTTPIKHLVVVFQENIPFDRYFGVYPRALNPPGEPRFEVAFGVDANKRLVLTAKDVKSGKLVYRDVPVAKLV